MRKMILNQVHHKVKIGDKPKELEPTLFEDTIFISDGRPIGFYLAKIPEKLEKLSEIANCEFRTDNVPKQEMSRGPQGDKKAKLERRKAGIELVTQYSTIIGSIPPKPHMRRPYATKSSVHTIASARTFVKAMIMAGRESLKIIEQISPEIYQTHKKAVESRVPLEWRFADLFTSSISNFNIAAAIHRDNLNVKGAVNVIITKRRDSNGGNLYIPDYDVTFNSANNSMLVYPAWRNMHGVTPIVPTRSGGYRNSLIWYALDAFREASDATG